jgi:5-methylcytosine-specific restriction protein A
MPTVSRKPCCKAGCGKLHTNRTGLCDAHQAQAQEAYDHSRGSAASRGYGEAWRILRGIKLRANPMCEANGCKHVASLVHHKDKNPLNNSQDNLMSVCNPCHELIHAQDRFKPRAAKAS